MTIEEIKTSVTMALVKAVTVENEKTTLHIQDDVVKQCDIVGEHLGKKFMFFCMREAQECLGDTEKLRQVFVNFINKGVYIDPSKDFYTVIKKIYRKMMDYLETYPNH